ncbi:MAG TPA: NUDIX domain-containing protein [Chloroflexi bacterium]|nr:NUDIX domain-containing protein [Chloroflexota bacterium]
MTKQHYPEPTVGGLIFNRAGKALLLRSHKWHDRYSVPGGHIELGETMEQALRREIEEETGLTVYDIEQTLTQEFIFDEAFYEQRHFIFFDFLCQTDAAEDAVVLNAESEAYVWVTLEEALALPLEPYTRILIEHVISENGGQPCSQC